MNTLAYLYVYELEGFNPFELNFSNRFSFKMGDNEILNIKKSFNPMEGLLGENIYDINIIAGENGVGKTTLIKLIADLMTEKQYGAAPIEFEYFALFQTGSHELTVKTTDGNRFAYDVDDSIDIIPPSSSFDFGHPVIYYSPFLDFNLLSIHNIIGDYPLIDLSATQMMISDLEGHVSEEEEDDLETMEIESNPVIRHKLSNIKRQVSFINMYGNEFKLPFNLPNNLELRFHRLSVDIDDVSGSGTEIMEQFRSLVSDHLREFPENGMARKYMARLIFLRNLVCLYFSAINLDKSRSILMHRYNQELSSEILNFNSKIPKELILLIEKFFASEDVVGTNLLTQLIKLVTDKINGKNVDFSDSNNLLTLTIKTQDNFLKEILALLNTRVKKRSAESRLITAFAKFISFDWSNFSSGEKMFIDLFSRLSISLDRLSGSKQSVLMIIDEGEMGFHPLWQIKYISTLRDFINEVFFEHKVQVLLATHSPLVLSDFPKERVHLFKKKGNKRVKESSIGTFGQNISEILASDFFIDSTLIGNLAKQYINGILEEINTLKKSNSPRRRRLISTKIDQIDDQIIYRLLMAQLEDSEDA